MPVSALACRRFLDDSLTSRSHWFAYYTGDPSGTGAEISGNNYARKQIGTSGWTFTTATGKGTAENTSKLNFTTPSGTWAWGSTPFLALFDASSGGNLIAWKSFVEDEPASGNSVFIPAGGFDIEIPVS